MEKARLASTSLAAKREMPWSDWQWPDLGGYCFNQLYKWSGTLPLACRSTMSMAL